MSPDPDVSAAPKSLSSPFRSTYDRPLTVTLSKTRTGKARPDEIDRKGCNLVRSAAGQKGGAPVKPLVFNILALCLLLPACRPADSRVHGYVEGEFVMLAPTTGGLLESLSVARGDKVGVGDALFALDLTDLRAQRDAAQADLRRAQAELADLGKGEREEEIEILSKQRAQAAATLANAQSEYERILPLSKSGNASLSALDAAKAARDSGQARLEELDARLKTAALGARTDRIAAAQAAADAAAKMLERAEKRLAEGAPAAPAAGIVDDTFFLPGEYVPAGRPVVSLLPPENVRIRFFVPQKVVPALHPGMPVTVTCDGCAAPVAAKILRIAPEAEFTPPVIYSVESRDKLVFLVEAAPDVPAPALHPGLPVDIAWEEGGAR